MKLINYVSNNESRLGIVTASGVLDIFACKVALSAELNEITLPQTMSDFYENPSDYLPALEQVLKIAGNHEGAWWLEEETLEIAPIVPAPGKILCVGLNYRRHAAEANMVVPTIPILFSKFNNTIAASGEIVPLPDTSTQCDYEAELVVVMGRTAENVSVENALEYVLGYCNGNDISARDLQLSTSQWLLGKTLDKFLPIGPYLVTADEIADPQNLNIKTWYQGELRQDSNTSDMVFSVAEIISYVSRHFALQPGDIIATGTPEGVILGDENPQWMKAGDEVIIEIEGLGRLENRMG